ncbi:MAG: hypothetical protein CME62_05240 [Halobacteriovoraceae bacterium]|nr:hypothetical protein [Halobacteriovoraceae bacterium]|tara:strand:+ start:6335 stop:6637 length:303 start_codon:yes stop_codon:yes gene_type:complete
MDDLKEKLKTEIEEADWSMIKPHVERGAVLLISSQLDLLDVGVAIAQDKVQFIKLWLDEGLITKTDDIDSKAFEEDQFKKQFKFIIIQPYVLIQHVTTLN